jgi:glycosyltransferase involved in cell wall biosynthesis
MKIAFVTYPIATLLPPYHGSMGETIYKIASALAKSCEVLVYGVEQKQMGAKSGIYEGARYRFLPVSAKDRLLVKVRRDWLSPFVWIRTPMSTSNLLYPSFGRQVATDLEKEKCDVIHVQHSTQYVPIIRARNPSAKIVLHIHAQWFSQCNLPVIERRIRSLDLLLTVSDYVTRKTQHDVPALADRCETMYNGIDIQDFDCEKNYESARRREEKRLLYIGGVWPHKGPHVLLDAFKIVAAQYQRIRLDIVGPQGSYPLEECFDLSDQTQVQSVAPFFAKNRWSLLKRNLGFGSADQGTYLNFLKAKLAGDLASKVAFHGYLSRSELIDHYYNADVFVFPPIWNEAFGCTPVEAMAAGTPVVSTRSGGIIETVRDQETGFLVEKNDSHALAEAILKLIENDALRESMGRAARSRALQHFSWDTIVPAMHNRYKRLC